MAEKTCTRGSWRPVAAVVSVLAVTLISPAAATAQAAPRETASPERPNIVLVTTDDMRADDLTYMPLTRQALGQLELTEFVSNHPLCCPARAELLTGQFAQNNGVHDNPGSSWGGYAALRQKNNTLARWFLQSGYSTALVGKFINGWRPGRLPPPDGWTDFQPLVGHAYSAYDYSYLDESRVRPARSGVHTNDFVTSETIARVNEYEGADAKPFMIWSSYVAPHAMTAKDGTSVPPVPAVRHRGTMAGVVPLSESKPSYEEPPPRQRVLASYQDLAGEPTQRQAARAADFSVRQVNQRRLESLQSVDEGIARIIRRLGALDELSRTVVVFTSDNGYLLGEHGLLGKNSYYQESLRVPLLARGPGVAEGESPKGSMMTDLAPSLARLASVTPQRETDGRSDLFVPGDGWSELLIQAGSDQSPWLWRGMLTAQFTYVERADGQAMLFDRHTDPFQLHDIAGQNPVVQDRLRESLSSIVGTPTARTSSRTPTYRAVDVAVPAGISTAVTRTWSAAPADFDLDGDQDVLVGYHPVEKLWRNDGGGTYVRVASEAWPSGAIDRHDCAWSDVDRNSLPDVMCSTGRGLENRVKHAGIDNELWLQTAPGEFSEVGTEWGIGDPCGRGRDVAFLDANGDRFPDLFLGNMVPRPVVDECDESPLYPGEESKLFLNVNGERFTHASRLGVFAPEAGTRCIERVDFNRDGWDDLFTCRAVGHAPRLYRNKGGRGFVDVTIRHRIGGAINDAHVMNLNGDGRPDLVTAGPRGFVAHVNDAGRFARGTVLSGPGAGVGMAVAAGDADGDGDQDVYAMLGDGAEGNPDDRILVNERREFVAVGVPRAVGAADDVVALRRSESGPAEFLVLNGYNLDGQGPVQLIHLARR